MWYGKKKDTDYSLFAWKCSHLPNQFIDQISAQRVLFWEIGFGWQSNELFTVLACPKFRAYHLFSAIVAALHRQNMIKGKAPKSLTISI